MGKAQKEAGDIQITDRSGTMVPVQSGTMVYIMSGTMVPTKNKQY
jgi:uncharacterized cupin superfamily protein